LGHSLELVHAELLPEDKVKIISEFKKEGPTAMIGDGINDAPALASADIGISMGISGSALASETGNIILMSNDIRKIPEAIKLARRTRWKVLENIILSITTKAAIIGLALGGYPFVWAAVVADVGTCLLVILNSMLLLRRGHKHGGNLCRSSTKSHNHKSGCGGTHDHDHAHHQHQHCHDHEHEHDHHHHHHHHQHKQEHDHHQHEHEHDHHQHEHEHDHHHHRHHQHEHDHEHDHHHHHSHETENMSQPQKCGGSHVSSSHHHHHHLQHQHEHDHEHEHDHHHHHSHETENIPQPQKCGGSHVSSSHHHHHHLQHQHEHEQYEHHHHNQHEHHSCNQHDHQNHSHNQLDQHQHPQQCVSSQTSSSTSPPCSSDSSLRGIVNHSNTMKGHDLFKRSDELHEHDHCHRGRCDKNEDGVQKLETENHGGSNSSSLILNAEDNHAVGNCLGHKAHGTKHCHNQHVDRVAHDGVSHSSPYHPILGCENLKDHKCSSVLHSNQDMHHKKSGCSPDFEKNGTGEISVDIIVEHELSPMHGCSSLAEKEKGSCCEGCSDTCENLPAVCCCEGSKEGEDSACCRDECSSKECKESPVVHVCLGWDKRELGGCCKSYMKECCGKLGDSRAGFVGGLSEIMTE